MFPMSVFGRSTRAIAAGALILSLTATTLVGSANAAPLANTEACSAASQARNDAVHALRDAWKASTSDLKALANGTPELRHDAMSSWHDLKDVLMQAVQDLRALGLVSACRDENESTTPTVVSATTDQAVKDIVDTTIKDLQAIVDAARKSVASQTAANAPKDSTASDDPEDSTVADEPKDQTDGANGDEDKDSHEGNNAQDEDRNANNEDKDDDAKDNSSEKSKAKSTTIVTTKNFAAAAKSAKLKGAANRHGHDNERD
jgi:hypothetical protein